MKLAIFDMDGLLFDSERLFMRELEKAMSERGYTLSLDLYLSMLGMNNQSAMRAMKNHYGEDYPYTEISKAARDSFNECVRKSGMPVKDGIEELIIYCIDCGAKCAVASSTAAKLVKEYLNICGFGKYFNAVIGGDMVRRSKPAPDIFLKACEVTDTLPSESVVFEDSENGICAAVNAGIPVICIPDMKKHGKEVVDMCAACVSDGAAAVEFLKNKNIC